MTCCRTRLPEGGRDYDGDDDDHCNDGDGIMMMKKSMRMDQTNYFGAKIHWDLYLHEDDHGHAAAHGHCHHRVYIDDDDDKGGFP